MHKIDLEKRLTHKYNQAYAYLDDSTHIGTAKHLTSKTKGDDESKRTFSLFLVTSNESETDVRDALRDTLASACSCEHDCCGHWQTHVSNVRRIKGSKLYAVMQVSNRNI